MSICWPKVAAGNDTDDYNADNDRYMYMMKS